MARNDKEELAILALILDEDEENVERLKKSVEKRKRLWVHQAWTKRGSEGEFITLYKELQDDASKFYEYFRMTPYTFNEFLKKLENSLKKMDTTVGSMFEVCYIQRNSNCII